MNASNAMAEHKSQLIIMGKRPTGVPVGNLPFLSLKELLTPNWLVFTVRFLSDVALLVSCSRHYQKQHSWVEAIKALGDNLGGLQFGGGVNPENAERYLAYGASHVIVTSYIFSQGELDLQKLQKLVTVVSKDKLHLDLSCRKKDRQYFVVTDRWQRFTNLVVNKDTVEELRNIADEFSVHGVDIEGKRLSVDEELITDKWLSTWEDKTLFGAMSKCTLSFF
ncbi:hypothetical protein MPTK2_3g25490 [Marchantia polymorpha subsp. ruderalis]